MKNEENEGAAGQSWKTPAEANEAIERFVADAVRGSAMQGDGPGFVRRHAVGHAGQLPPGTHLTNTPRSTWPKAARSDEELRSGAGHVALDPAQRYVVTEANGWHGTQVQPVPAAEVPTAEEGAAAVERLGIDVGAMAERMRARGSAPQVIGVRLLSVRPASVAPPSWLDISLQTDETIERATTDRLCEFEPFALVAADPATVRAAMRAAVPREPAEGVVAAWEWSEADIEELARMGWEAENATAWSTATLSERRIETEIVMAGMCGEEGYEAARVRAAAALLRRERERAKAPRYAPSGEVLRRSPLAAALVASGASAQDAADALERSNEVLLQERARMLDQRTPVVLTVRQTPVAAATLAITRQEAEDLAALIEEHQCCEIVPSYARLRAFIAT